MISVKSQTLEMSNTSRHSHTTQGQDPGHRASSLSWLTLSLSANTKPADLESDETYTEIVTRLGNVRCVSQCSQGCSSGQPSFITAMKWPGCT